MTYFKIMIPEKFEITVVNGILKRWYFTDLGSINPTAYELNASLVKNVIKAQKIYAKDCITGVQDFSKKCAYIQFFLPLSIYYFHKKVSC